MTSIQQTIVTALLAGPMTRRAVAKATGLDSHDAKLALDELVRVGLVAKSGAGAGTKYRREGR